MMKKPADQKEPSSPFKSNDDAPLTMEAILCRREERRSDNAANKKTGDSKDNDYYASDGDGDSKEFLMDVVRSRASRTGGGGDGSRGGGTTSDQTKMMSDDDDKNVAKKMMINAYIDDDQQGQQDDSLRFTIATATATANASNKSAAPMPIPKKTLNHTSSGPFIPMTELARSYGNFSLPGAFPQSPSQGGGCIVQEVDSPAQQAPASNDDLSWPTLPLLRSQATAAPAPNGNSCDNGQENNLSTRQASFTAPMSDLEEGCTGSSIMDNSTLLAAELVPQYEEADVLLQDVILLSPQEKEKMANCKKRLLVLIAALIALVGSAASVAFMATGVTKALQEEDSKFETSAQESIQNIQDAFEEYVNAVAMVHMRCRKRDFSRQDFQDLYEYLLEEGLQFKAVQFLPNTTNEERPAREADSRSFYAQHYPYINYTGFRGFNHLNASGGLQPRKEEPWYFPIHYMEPIRGNEAAIDLDYHSSEVRIRAVNAVFQNAKPSLSDRLNLVKKNGQVSRCGNHNGPSYGVVLAHPGINLTRTSHPTSTLSNPYEYHHEERPAYNASNPDAGFVDDVWPRDMAAMVVCIPDLLAKSMAHHDHDFQSKAIYIHDRNHLCRDPVFMGGAEFHAPRFFSNAHDAKGREAFSGADLTFLDQVPLEELKGPSKIQQLKYQESVNVANRIWTVTVVASEGTYKPKYMFVLLGGVIVFVGTLFVALWVYRMSAASEEVEQEAAEEDGKHNNHNESRMLGGSGNTDAMGMEEDHA